MDSIEERVQRGVKLLDKECPDWREKIDLDILNLSGVTVDILGQLFGYYKKVTEENWKIHAEINRYSGEYFVDRAAHLGLSSKLGTPDKENEELTKFWKNLLKPKDKVRELCSNLVSNYFDSNSNTCHIIMCGLKAELQKEKEKNDNQ